jgi:hypothetical protein
MQADVSNDELGTWIVVVATATCVAVAAFVTHIYPVQWFRERLLSGVRGTRAFGMLPIAFPIYLFASLAFKLLRQ